MNVQAIIEQKIKNGMHWTFYKSKMKVTVILFLRILKRILK